MGRVGMSVVDEGSRCSLQEEWRQKRGVETESREYCKRVENN